MANPTTNRAISSAMTTAVKIWTPTGSFSRPSSISTLATRPRLDSDSTPASASACVKLRPRCTSKKTSVVTASDTSIDMVTESTEARKRRPRMAARKPLMSSSSRPMRKKNMNMPMPRMISTSDPRLHQAGCGPKDDARGGVGDDGVQAKALEDAFQQLGAHNEQPDGEESLMDFQAAMSSLSSRAASNWRERPWAPRASASPGGGLESTEAHPRFRKCASCGASIHHRFNRVLRPSGSHHSPISQPRPSRIVHHRGGQCATMGPAAGCFRQRVRIVCTRRGGKCLHGEGAAWWLTLWHPTGLSSSCKFGGESTSAAPTSSSSRSGAPRRAPTATSSWTPPR